MIETDSLTLPQALVKTIKHFVPVFFNALVEVPDPRDPTRTIYPIEEELFVGILAFMLRVKARRNIKFALHTPAFIKNLLTIMRVAFPKSKALLPIPEDALLHGDTLDYLLSKLDWRLLHALRTLVISVLLRKRCLENFRLRGFYKIAVDGTRCWSFQARHCDRCMTQKLSDGSTMYYHPVLEAKLAAGGMALSIATEFMENDGKPLSKQDCELKAFDRLAAQLKLDFPRLPIVLLLDGEFACQRILRLCEDNSWEYLITFREGRMPAVFAEYEAVLNRERGQRSMVWMTTQCRQTYRWANDVDCNGRAIHVLECAEEIFDKEGAVVERHRFVHISSFRVDEKNVPTLSQGGRDRWVIENQGFNTQKNGGYELEHAYSENNTAMKGFYLLMQIAHIFTQLLEKGSLLRERIQEEMGSLKVFALKMWAALTEVLIDPVQLRHVLAQRVQIRLDTG